MSQAAPQSFSIVDDFPALFEEFARRAGRTSEFIEAITVAGPEVLKHVFPVLREALSATPSAEAPDHDWIRCATAVKLGTDIAQVYGDADGLAPFFVDALRFLKAIVGAQKNAASRMMEFFGNAAASSALRTNSATYRDIITYLAYVSDFENGAPDSLREAALDALVKIVTADEKTQLDSVKLAMAAVRRWVEAPVSNVSPSSVKQCAGTKQVALDHVHTIVEAAPKEASTVVSGIVEHLQPNDVDAPLKTAAGLLIAASAASSGDLVKLFRKLRRTVIDKAVKATTAQAPVVRAAGLVMLGSLFEGVPPIHGDLIPALIPAASTAVAGDELDVVNTALGILDSCLDGLFFDTDADQHSWMAGNFPMQTFNKAVTLITTEGTEDRLLKTAFKFIGTVVTKWPSGVLDRVPEIVNFALPLLRIPANDADLGSTKEALECVTLIATGIGSDEFKPYETATCQFLADSMPKAKPTSEFMGCLIRAWTCMGECLGRGIEPWLPHYIETILAGCELVIEPTEKTSIAESGNTSDGDFEEFVVAVPCEGVKTLVIDLKAVKYKTQCLNTLGVMLMDISLTVFAPGHVARAAAAAVSTLTQALASEFTSAAATIITNILCRQRQDGTTEQHIDNVAAIAALGRSLASGTNDAQYECMTALHGVVASTNGTLPLDVFTNVENEVAQVAVEVAAQIKESDGADDDVDGNELECRFQILLEAASVLGHLAHAVVTNDAEKAAEVLTKHISNMFAAFMKVGSLRWVAFALFTSQVSFGNATLILRKCKNTLLLAQSEFDSDELELRGWSLRLAGALIQAATHNASIIETPSPGFISSLIDSCTATAATEIESDIDDNIHAVRAAVNALLITAEWLKINKGPDAAAAAVAIAAPHIDCKGITVTDLGAVTEARSINERLARWAADPELSGVYFAFPVSRDDVLETIAWSKHLTPVTGAFLQEAYAIDPADIRPDHKRRRE